MPLTETQVKEICNRYEGGATLKELANDFGCSQPTISKHLKDSGVTVRSKGRRKKEKPKVDYASVVKDFEPKKETTFTVVRNSA